MTQNYAALGEYHAYKKQANDAATRRFIALSNLAGQARKLAGEPGQALDAVALRGAVDEAVAAEREMLAAIERANQAADLCGEQPVALRSLARD